MFNAACAEYQKAMQSMKLKMREYNRELESYLVRNLLAVDQCACMVELLLELF